MEKKNKKLVEQKNPTQKIEFSDVLMEVTDDELLDYYSQFSSDKLHELLKDNLPEQDQKIINQLLKKLK